MKRSEFLEQLRQELAGKIPDTAVHEQLDYYTRYISEQVADGVPEDQVVDELGDPWIIARNVIADYERKHADADAAREQAARDAKADRDYAMSQRKGGAFTYIMVLLIAILIIVLIVSAVVGTMAFLFRQLPVLFFIIVVVWVVHRLRN